MEEKPIQSDEDVPAIDAAKRFANLARALFGVKRHDVPKHEPKKREPKDSHPAGR